MSPTRFLFPAVLMLIQFNLYIGTPKLSLAQEWKARGHRGTLKVVDLWNPYGSMSLNYAEAYVPY